MGNPAFHNFVTSQKADFAQFLADFRPKVGNLRPADRIWPAEENHPARDLFTNFVAN